MSNSLQMGSSGIAAIKGSLLWEQCSPIKKEPREREGASEVLSQLSTSIAQTRYQI